MNALENAQAILAAGTWDEAARERHLCEAEVSALVAQAEALTRIADRLDACVIDSGDGVTYIQVERGR